MVHNKWLSKSEIFCARPLPSLRLQKEEPKNLRQHEETFIRERLYWISHTVHSMLWRLTKSEKIQNESDSDSGSVMQRPSNTLGSEKAKFFKKERRKLQECESMKGNFNVEFLYKKSFQSFSFRFWKKKTNLDHSQGDLRWPRAILGPTKHLEGAPRVCMARQPGSCC